MSNKNSSNKYNEDKTQIANEIKTADHTETPIDPCLTQLSGHGSGQVFNIRDKVVTIGRDPACSIWIDDPHISRTHATLVNKEETTVITDMESTNGIFVNGTKVQTHSLINGDRILIGTRLHFKFSMEFADYQIVQNQKYQQANYDSLTKLYNKRFFIDLLSREFSFSRRNKQPLSLLMMDIDYFKKINDSYGHLAGDQVLSQLGHLLKKELRHENVACRYGGEEFAVVLRNANTTSAEIVAERIRYSIEKLTVSYMNHSLKLTVSIGVSSYEHANFETYEELITSADEQLYEAKYSGRNRVTFKKAA
ncbi:MAG: GGDEF domain-containing protein [Bdellovibrionales bacterium]|nr:GGDEF domain-containing protein [Bdellovibrionales bacterium]